MSEAGMQSRFLKWANAREDTEARALSATSLAHRAGDPDTFGVTAGVPWFMELKQKGEMPRKIQLQRLREWRHVGCEAEWFDDIGMAKAWVRSFLQSPRHVAILVP